jgi:alpha-tubulin suppressor-like RCC1 family protein
MPLFPTRIAGDDGWTDLAIGWHRGLGIRNGELDEWSDSITTPQFLDANGTWDQISIQHDNVCLLKSGAVTCDGQAVAGSWSYIAAGVAAFCGIKDDHTLWCWGTDSGNMLGRGVEPDGTVVASPAQVGSEAAWKDVWIGINLACARKLDNTLWCWGAPNNTGTNGVDTIGVPTQISARTDWSWFDVHWEHACGGVPDGTVECWGNDGYGLEVLPGSTTVSVPSVMAQKWDLLVMGGHHYCGLTGGRWYCWGWNAAGQLGIGSTTTHQVPTVPVCASGT